MGVTSGQKPPSLLTETKDFCLYQVLKEGSQSHSVTFEKPTEVESIPAYNSIYYTSALNEVGRFDEDLQGCEEWELNYRLRKKGKKLLGIPRSPVEHRLKNSYRSFFKEQLGYAWSRAHLLKRKGIFTLKHSLPLLSFLAFTIILFFIHDYATFLFLLYFPSLFTLSLLITDTRQFPRKPYFNLNVFLKVTYAFFLFHVAWALGYLKGLIEG